MTPLNFQAAGLSDADFNDLTASGVNGEVMVGGAAATPTATEEVATATATQPLATPTETLVPATATQPAATATATETSVPATATSTAPPPATETSTAIPATETPTQPSEPLISIGSGSGMPGDMGVSVPISFNGGGTNIILIGPLEFSFDAAVLTYESCASSLPADYTVQSAIPDTGLVRMVIQSGSNLVIPAGQIATCSFTISASASGGTMTPLTFKAAGMSDEEFNDISASGINGSIAVQ